MALAAVTGGGTRRDYFRILLVIGMPLWAVCFTYLVVRSMLSPVELVPGAGIPSEVFQPGILSVSVVVAGLVTRWAWSDESEKN